MQLLAMLTMLIDHIGIVFYPDDVLWRYIGRIAMPLYAYSLVTGYRHTSNMRRYLIRLTVIAAISQIPYYYVFLGPDDPYEINVVGTLLVCLAVLWGIDRTARMPAVTLLIAATAFVVLELLRFDYGAYLLLLVLIYRYARNGAAVGLHGGLEAIFLFIWPFQYWSLIATVVLVYGNKLLRFLDRVAVPRWLWRSFYPAHLAALALLVPLLI